VIATFLLLSAAAASHPETVGGFAYRTIVSHRVKRVKSAPDGYAPTWKEHLETLTSPRDAGFSQLMKREMSRSLREFYSDDDCTSFASCTTAGDVEIDEELIAASRDVVSVSIGTGFYRAGMAHPQYMSSRSLIWSRRLGRLMKQEDVFARAPDRALRRLAQKKFDNRENMTNPDDPDGIPLEWTHASIGPQGINWSYEPYELGGYLSAGNAMLSWAALKPYLRRSLPFTISAIKLPRPNSR
jgi:hypothetical protein